MLMVNPQFQLLEIIGKGKCIPNDLYDLKICQNLTVLGGNAPILQQFGPCHPTQRNELSNKITEGCKHFDAATASKRANLTGGKQTTDAESKDHYDFGAWYTTGGNNLNTLSDIKAHHLPDAQADIYQFMLWLQAFLESQVHPIVKTVNSDGHVMEEAFQAQLMKYGSNFD